jgi:hypothetical protein
MSSDVDLFLGGLQYRLTAEGYDLSPDLDPAYRSFLVELPSPEPSVDSVSVRFTTSGLPPSDGHTLFRSSAAWTILAEGDGRAFRFRHPGAEPLYVARFRPGVRDVSIACSARLIEARPGTPVLHSPFAYPLDQVVSMYLLNGRGLTVHAAGALVGGRGILLAGVSGAGKTTISRLAAGRLGWQPLSDDRVIVRLAERGGATVYGTPWPGEGATAENRSGPVEWLLFLAQGRTNAIERLVPRQALPHLLKTVSVPWYDRQYLPGALDACDRLVQEVPAVLLTFRPDAGAVDAIEGLLDGRIAAN